MWDQLDATISDFIVNQLFLNLFRVWSRLLGQATYSTKCTQLASRLFNITTVTTGQITICRENAVWPPEDGRKDARNMFRNNLWGFSNPVSFFIYAVCSSYVPNFNTLTWSLRIWKKNRSMKHNHTAGPTGPRGLKSGSEAASLLGLWVGIPPGARKSASCKCWILSGRGFCDGLISLPEKSYRGLCI